MKINFTDRINYTHQSLLKKTKLILFALEKVTQNIHAIFWFMLKDRQHIDSSP
jgi:hypothetical protein